VLDIALLSLDLPEDAIDQTFGPLFLLHLPRSNRYDDRDYRGKKPRKAKHYLYYITF